jgi:hypothetical protein
MKKLLLILFITLFYFSQSKAQIWSHNFESSGGYTTSDGESTSGISDYFIRTDGSNIDATFSNIQGSYYFAAQDIDAAPTPLLSDIGTILFDDINISGQSNLSFEIFLAEDDASDSNEDWDSNSYLHISYDIDNSGSFTNLIWIESSATTSNTEPAIDSDFNGIGEGSKVTSSFSAFSNTIIGTGSTIDIKIEIGNLSDGDEDIAIDNLSLTSLPTTTSVQFTSSSASVSEGDGTYDLTLSISNPDAVELTECQVSWSSSTGANPTATDIGNYSTQTVTFPANSSTNQTVSISLTDDIIFEGTETFSFSIINVSGGNSADVGGQNTFELTIEDNDLKPEPTNHVDNVSASSITSNSMTLNWDIIIGGTDADGYYLFINTDEANLPSPIDGTEISGDIDFSDGNGAVLVNNDIETYTWSG